MAGKSIARYGEGELRYCVKGMPIKSQLYDSRLAVELLNGLKSPGECLLALPRVWNGMPAEKFWRQFEHDAYTKHYCFDNYGSAFISRSDMVHDIDRADYWANVRSLWAGKDVTLVGQSIKILPMSEAKSVTFVKVPEVNAYAEIDNIEEEVVKTVSNLNRTKGTVEGPIFLCIGATATVLAIRLAKKGYHALDMGHMGRFMQSEGCYNLEEGQLISDEYLRLQRKLHASCGEKGYGNSGRKQARNVLNFAEKVRTPRILDYGCGEGTLKTALRELGCKLDIMEYDPAVKGREKLPKPSELVVCTDVLEHVEPEKIDAVIKHIFNLTKKAAYILVATRPASRVLADGRNAHLIQERPAYWAAKLRDVGFKITGEEVIAGLYVIFWCYKWKNDID